MKNIITIVLTLFLSAAAYAQCTPDAALNACTSGVDAALGTLSGGESGTVSGLEGEGSSVSFTAVAGAQYTFDICGNSNPGDDPGITILDASTCAPASVPTQVTGNFNDDACGVWSAITFTAIAAGNYVVYITQFGCLSNSFMVPVSMAYSVVAPPPPPPACGAGNPIPSDICYTAPSITNLNGFCGTTLASYNDEGVFFGGCAGSYTIENNSWLKFTAALEEVVINYWITGGASCASGIQLAVVQGPCNGGGMFSVACASNPTGGIGSTGTLSITGLTPGQDYYLMIDGYAGDVCDYVFGVESGVALSCATCDVDACATNPVQTDFPTSETNFGGNCWDAIGAATASGDIVEAHIAGTNTVCTDFDASAFPDFIGFDGCISYINENGSTGFQNTAFVTSVTLYQEITGSCVALVPTSYNIYGQPEFDNNVTAGTTAGDPGSYDPAIPITYCYTYTSDGTGAVGDDDVSGNTAVAYGCTQVTNVAAGTQSACNSGDNTYTQQITVTLANNPTGLTGDDQININGQSFTVTSNPQTFTLTGLVADGNPVTVTTYLEVSTGCERVDAALFTAPIACSVACPTTTVTCGTSTTTSLSGSGAWNVTSCGFSTLLQEAIYEFTPTTTGTHTLQITAASGGFADYFYKVAGGTCDETGWTCIYDLNSVATVSFGPLTAGTTYWILLDSETATLSVILGK
ncbi:MAG: hypothetical protein IPL35_16925 [Sphingobacteriales bacterium]|nr:hypothetical protein [Sphingobacteriales bacterium]